MCSIYIHSGYLIPPGVEIGPFHFKIWNPNPADLILNAHTLRELLISLLVWDQAAYITKQDLDFKP